MKYLDELVPNLFLHHFQFNTKYLWPMTLYVFLNHWFSCDPTLANLPVATESNPYLTTEEAAIF